MNLWRCWNATVWLTTRNGYSGRCRPSGALGSLKVTQAFRPGLFHTGPFRACPLPVSYGRRKSIDARTPYHAEWSAMKRVLTAVVLIPLVLLLVFRGPGWLFVAVAAVFGI